MFSYKKLNNLVGWLVFAIAAFTYLSTLAPTASFWDCSEFIAAAYKLEVGHPPGAPFFLLAARLFTLLAGGNTEKVAVMVNTLSGLASAFTILFLFWTITHLVKKMTDNSDEPLPVIKFVILASGVVGALAYTFSDTFWFSAVEGEVYGSSSLFTALVFWSILKWENCADQKYANRWLILIAYLIGLSIGVHLLNLLAIPAIGLIFYFRKYPYSPRGMWIALGVSVLILGSIMYLVIPGAVKLAAVFELLFVNVFGFGYFSGVAFYLILLSFLLVFGIYYTRKKNKVLWNTILLSLTVILIGYSSYAMIVIRSQANPPMNEDNPENLFSLLSYLDRVQYGERPLLYGQYFNAPAKSESNGSPVYRPKDGKYKIITHREKVTYDRNFETLFPRIYSSEDDHIDAYLQWTGLKESDLYKPRMDQHGRPVYDQYGQIVYDHDSPIRTPGFIANLSFFLRYQLGYMYLRYFLWNFSGRQNDKQGSYKEDITKGNWITGIKSIDAARLGNQDFVPDYLKKNRGRNKYYMIPLILGLIGMFFQFRQDRKNFWVVMALFFFTGIAIVLYLNQTPLQPRERDYAYAGSFYAFAIWIGMAVAALYRASKEADLKSVRKKVLKALITVAVLGIIDIIANDKLSYTAAAIYGAFMIIILPVLMQLLGRIKKSDWITAGFAFLLCMIAPSLMACQNWNDHDRSGRYVARDFASDYLNSCDKNALLFTNGDNDTFPLWYAQEVEGIRTDVRVINLSYLSADWYIQQMSRRVYQSAPVKMILTPDEYELGKRELVYLYDYKVKGYVNLKDAIKFVASDDAATKRLPGISERVDYIPTHKFSLPADSAKVFSNGTIKPQMASRFVHELRWKINRSVLTKNLLMILDFLASNNWDRPICYAITVSNDNYLNLGNFFEMQGLAYRIIPAVTTDSINFVGGINTDVMYDNMMHKFKWGGIENPHVYIDENAGKMFLNMRENFADLAKALILQHKPDSASKALDKCLKLMPDQRIHFGLYMLDIVEDYYMLNNIEKAHEVAKGILHNTYQDVEYFLSLKAPYSDDLDLEKRIARHELSRLINLSEKYNDKRFSAEIQQHLERYGPALNRIFK